MYRNKYAQKYYARMFCVWYAWRIEAFQLQLIREPK